ncbi:MAG: hypothetical protein IPQ02_17795 [Saprospiraceae bacterium]|nr:hypothetical protein [Candidatus Defluviibacterium haderslevense]MCC7027212.1 hypothetical protein [Saprospiraceae bacterium]
MVTSIDGTVSSSSLIGKNMFTTTITNFESIPIKDKIVSGVYFLNIKDKYSNNSIIRQLIVLLRISK